MILNAEFHRIDLSGAAVTGGALRTPTTWGQLLARFAGIQLEEAKFAGRFFDQHRGALQALMESEARLTDADDGESLNFIDGSNWLGVS